MGFLRHLRVLYVQVLIGVALGVLVGALSPQFGANQRAMLWRLQR